MLNLKRAKLIGVGKYRQCFEHPLCPDYVVKVQHYNHDDSNCLESSHNRELAFYSKISGCNNHFPKFIGIEKTSLGEGLVFKKILCSDGSKPLHLFEKYKDRKIPIALLLQIRIIMNQLENDALLTCAVNHENIMVVITPEGEHVISCE